MRDQLGGREMGPRSQERGPPGGILALAGDCRSLCQPEVPRSPPEQQKARCRLGPRGCDTGPCSQVPHLGA